MRPILFDAPILTVSDATMVCYCAKVTKGQLRAAVADGCRTIEALRIATGCCPKENDCMLNHPQNRCCMPEIAELLGHFLAVCKS